MAKDKSRSVGNEHYNARLLYRVHNFSPEEGNHEGHPGSFPTGQTLCVRRGNPWPCKQESGPHCSSFSGSQSHQIEFLLSSQEARSVETDPQSKASKQSLYKDKTFQDGNSGVDHSNFDKEHVGYVDRSQGRISTHSDPPRLPKVPGVPLQKHRLSVQRSPVWPCNRSTGLHSGLQSRFSVPQEKRNPSICLPGRLAHSSSHQRSGLKRHKVRDHYIAGPRLGHKLGQIKSGTFPGSHLPGGSSELHFGKSFSNSGENPNRVLIGDKNSREYLLHGPSMASFPGCHSQPSRHFTILPTQNAPSTISAVTTLQTGQSLHANDGSVRGGIDTVHTVVGESSEHRSGERFFSAQSSDINHNRCLQLRLGGCLGRPLDLGPLVRQGASAPHQCVGTSCRSKGHRSLGRRTANVRSDCPIRQLHDRVVHKPSRGHQVQDPLPNNVGSTNPLPGIRDKSEGQSSSRKAEHPSRRPFQGQVQRKRVVPLPDVGQSCFSALRPPIDGPVCHSGQCQASGVLHEILSPPGVGNGRSSSELEQPLDLRLSSVEARSHCPAETISVQRGHVIDRSMLAEPAMVPVNPPATSGPSVQVSEPATSSNSKQRPDTASRHQSSTLDSVEIVNRRFQAAGLSQRAAELATRARRGTTSKTYNSRLEKFFQWSASHSKDPLEASVDDVCSFLILLFDEGKQVSTIRNYRSAISAVHKGFQDGSTLSNNEAVSKLLRGMFNSRPPVRRLAPSWSINEVLRSLMGAPYEPMDRAPLDALTHKTLFLVAAASARRRSELHALSVKKGFIRFSPAGVHLLPDPSFLAKNQSASFTPKAIVLPTLSSVSSIREDHLLCPVRALKWYTHRTKHLRGSTALFILPRSPYTPASKDTISKWLIRLILPHVQPNEYVRAHDIRAHASSKAWFQGVPLQDIMDAAAWKTPSSFVSCYLTDIISADSNFARAVLRGSVVPDTNLPPASRC